MEGFSLSMWRLFGLLNIRCQSWDRGLQKLAWDCKSIRISNKVKDINLIANLYRELYQKICLFVNELIEVGVTVLLNKNDLTDTNTRINSLTKFCGFGNFIGVIRYV